MTAPPIEVLIIRPDTSHAVETVEQDLKTMQGLVGGYLRAIPTEVATILCNEDAGMTRMPMNRMATYLWWKLQPEFEGHDHLCGCVVVTGPPAGDLLTSVVPDLLRLWREMDDIGSSGPPC